LGDGQQPGSVMPVFNLTLRHFFYCIQTSQLKLPEMYFSIRNRNKDNYKHFFITLLKHHSIVQALLDS